MKVLLIGLGCSLAAFAAKPVGGGGACTNTGLKWEIRTTMADGTLTQIYDTLGASYSNSGVYTNGADGVAATIDKCGKTFDAKLVLNGSSRDVGVHFINILDENTLGNNLPPGTVSCLNICWMFVIQKLNYRDDEGSFTTHLAGGGPLNGHLWMMADGVEAVANVTDSRVNAPEQNSKVNVYHCPANLTALQSGSLCSLNTNEQWFVSPDAAAVASFVVDANRKQHIDGGSAEYSVPFYFVLTAQ